MVKQVQLTLLYFANVFFHFETPVSATVVDEGVLECCQIGWFQICGR